MAATIPFTPGSEPLVWTICGCSSAKTPAHTRPAGGVTCTATCHGRLSRRPLARRPAQWSPATTAAEVASTSAPTTIATHHQASARGCGDAARAVTAKVTVRNPSAAATCAPVIRRTARAEFQNLGSVSVVSAADVLGRPSACAAAVAASPSNRHGGSTDSYRLCVRSASSTSTPIPTATSAKPITSGRSPCPATQVHCHGHSHGRWSTSPARVAWKAMRSGPIRTATSTAFTVRARHARFAVTRCHANHGPDGRSPPSPRYIQPARFASRNGTSSSHSTRTPDRDVSPPHEYASTCRAGTSPRAGRSSVR